MSFISTAPPDAAPLLPPSRDVLGTVIEFVRRFACYPPEVPMLPASSFVRAWQSLAQLPADVSEYCIVTDLSAVRRGSNTYWYEPEQDGARLGTLTMGKLIEHSVQVDFYGTDPQTSVELTRTRAHLLELMANSTEGNRNFARINPALSLMYCDEVQSAPGLDEGHNLNTRHFVVLHIGQNIQATLPQRFITAKTRVLSTEALAPADNP